jgi:hypothetical protein
MLLSPFARLRLLFALVLISFLLILYAQLWDEQTPTIITISRNISSTAEPQPSWQPPGEVDVSRFEYKMEVASDQELWELKKKVIIIVTTVEKNRDRLQVIREAIKDDEWARDLFVFISDVSHPEEEDVLTYPGECNQTKWLPAKCCRYLTSLTQLRFCVDTEHCACHRFKKWYFETWEQQYPEVEWVFKADDDTYVNARNLLLAIASFGGSGHNSTVARTQPVFLGHRSHPNPDYNAIPNMWPHGGGTRASPTYTVNAHSPANTQADG